jgi:hypothetical protein
MHSVSPLWLPDDDRSYRYDGNVFNDRFESPRGGGVGPVGQNVATNRHLSPRLLNDHLKEEKKGNRSYQLSMFDNLLSKNI